ncbi:hypothetical protein PV10_04481 [Exophiala mesophila]|uniref:N-acetyltransferase domain-containing protein n=1 Tax=Exophiala mesophila TaxID=212818 RepID=A0A0D1ZHF9_EXOME|nr:uncharacterized protein PV10_04481 [Exophiala mesophila]KIV93254.1 hypothetical protein PV10_04481 [Exophiala mesophila]
MPLHAGVNLVTSSTPHLSSVIDGIVAVHAGCIIHDNTMATFMPPLDYDKMVKWWNERVAEVTAGERQIVVYLAEPSSRTSTGGFDSESQHLPAPPFLTGPDAEKSYPPLSPTSASSWISPASKSSNTWPTIPATSTSPLLEIAGLVSLSFPYSQTGPFRGMIEKLLTSPLHRRKGVARQVMAELERVAWKLGKWNLLLDTTMGTDAEHVYPRLGYVERAQVREFGFSPRDMTLLDEIWFAKDLRVRERRLWREEEEGETEG